MFYDVLKNLRSTDDNLLVSSIDEAGRTEHAMYVNGSPAEVTEGFDAAFSYDEYSSGSGKIMKKAGISYFAESIGIRRKAVICGGGHVALNVLKLLVMLGIETYVLEDRLSFAEEAKKNGAEEVFVGSYRENLEHIGDGEDLCYIIMTRGHRYDMECLEYVLSHRFAYAGMMTSRKRIRTARELMAQKGIPNESFDKIHAPIGVSIGAETPEEIAVSVCAEIISELHRLGTNEMPKEIVSALTDHRERVLAEIVSRKGPAPRLPGTKMVVFRDGSFAGTIGGGCFEAEVIRKARDLMTEGTGGILMTVDLTGGDSSAADGMACGGVMEVLLEYLPPH